jgi:intein/homing endonuclease
MDFNRLVKNSRIIRHKTEKKLYKVTTDLGIVTVTEDHSLLDIHKNIVKPSDIKDNREIELLYGYPNHFPVTIRHYQFRKDEMKMIVHDLIYGFMTKIPYDILNNTINIYNIYKKIII